MGRGEHGDTEHKSVGNQAFLAPLLLEQRVVHLLRLLYSQSCMGKKKQARELFPNIPHLSIS